ncbi:SpoVR family protein [Thermaerobacter sp. PB12/4term]|uniref:SpoVR family protein n=1 Tax=Thermaerobacter sp. PB12/4term TaxID=2293838 RepID=UPI000E32A486|nr:SpoVR family protein [Thermaerobacter sp. PB12/4term]QIA26406.1 SpoVR family protein [Thermaerobacter sp. PB12/4term]
MSSPGVTASGPGAEGLLPHLERIWAVARDLGFDPLPTHFEVVPAPVVYEVAAYGLPGRFTHWSHGKAYHLLKTRHDYGLHRIYELVINADPCQAFLLESNSLFENLFVAAHVAGHADFFHHNVFFRRAGREMAGLAAVHAERVRRYEYDHGVEAVERVLDAALALEPHTDPWLAEEQQVPPLRPGEPFEDVLLFIQHHAPHLEDWERDLLAMVRAERLYFWPQIRTKVMNEGWACIAHSRILRRLDLPDGDYTEFARLHAAIQASSPFAFNPYAVGYHTWERILATRGWDEARFILETEDDVAFLRNHLDRQVAEACDLYIYARQGDQWVIVEDDWARVRDLLVLSRVRGGFPLIAVVDGDYRGRGELLLRHIFDGRELDLDEARQALALVERLWRRPVHLETRAGGHDVVLSVPAGDKG